GVTGTNNPGGVGFNYGSDWANIPTDQLMFLMRTMRRYVVGGDGSFDLFGKDWSWSSYFQHGETDTSIKIYNMPLSGAPLAGGNAVAATSIQTNRQEAFSFSVNGSPIDDWAGPVAVAAGYEYREEHFSQRADPYSGGITASTPATVNMPCTDPFIDCGLTTQG